METNDMNDGRAVRYMRADSMRGKLCKRGHAGETFAMAALVLTFLASVVAVKSCVAMWEMQREVQEDGE